MRANHVKEKLLRGENSVGIWLSLPHPGTAKLLAHAGFDWVLVDFEHSPYNPTLVSDMIHTIADTGAAAPFVRVPTNSVEYFKWVLDAGAWGVMVPMVNTPEEAQYVADCMQYPPQGKRSIGGIYKAYSFQASNTEYMREANDHLLTMVQIESRTALENLDGILSVPGIDVAFVGPNDLCASLGVTPFSESQDPIFLGALEQIKAGAKKHGKALGIFCSNGEAAAKRLAEGFNIVNCSSDASSVVEGATRNYKVALA